MFYTDEGSPHFSDNYLDLLPGRTYEIEHTPGIDPSGIKTRYVQ